MSVTSGIGLVSQVEKFGRTIAGAQYKNYYVLQKDDFAYNKSATKDFPQGYVALYRGNSDVAVPNSIFSCFRVLKGEAIPKYLGFLFENNFHGRWLQKYLTVGARAHGSLNISDEDILSIPLPVPNMAEQEQIADGLSILDCCIAAETRKLDALKAHKQGLMQQLFPAEGQRLPRLRLSGFSGEWRQTRLGDEGDFLTSLTGKKGDDFGDGNANFVPYTNVFANTFTDTTVLGSVKISASESQNAVRKGDVFFTISSETPEEAGMSSVLLEDIPDCYLNSFCTIFRFGPAKVPNPIFTGYLLRQPIVRSHLSAKAQGSTRFNLSKDAFRNIPILLPTKPEQQRIADCLNGLDSYITAQTLKIVALRQQKKGLMQGLFPAPDTCIV